MRYRWSLINVLVIILIVYLGSIAWIEGDSCIDCQFAFWYFIPVAIGALVLDLILQCLVTKRKWLLITEIIIVVATVWINSLK